MARHTMDTAEIISFLTAQRSEEGQPTCTIDVATFQETFGSELAAGSASARRNRRRETADPSKLRELLQQCVIEDEAEEAEKNPREKKRASMRAPAYREAAQARQRRITCDPRLLKQLVVDGVTGLSSVDEDATETTALDECPPEAPLAAAPIEPPLALDDEPLADVVPTEEEVEVEEPAIFEADETALEVQQEEEEDYFAAEAYNRRGSVAWTFDEQRATLQLKVEKELAMDAESERDELAKELSALRNEHRARKDLLKALEEQRDAAVSRAATFEQRATRAEHHADRAEWLMKAAEVAADARVADAVAESRGANEQVDDALEGARRAHIRADRADADAQRLRDELADALARIAALERVKITKSFAAKVHETVEERDRLATEVATLRAEKENNGKVTLPFTERAAPSRNPQECRQS